MKQITQATRKKRREVILPYDPEDEGKNHMNIYKDSKFGVARFLYPGTPSIRIDSALGFSYTTLIAPIKYMKFTEADVLLELMHSEKEEGEKLYQQYLNTKKTAGIHHFRTIMLFLIWERAVLDRRYRESINSMGEFVLVCYEIKNITANKANIRAAKETTFNCWLPKAIKETKRAIQTKSLPDLASFKNAKHPNTSWKDGVASIPDDFDEKVAALLDKATTLNLS